MTGIMSRVASVAMPPGVETKLDESVQTMQEIKSLLKEILLELQERPL